LTVAGDPGIPVPDDLVLVAHVSGAYGIAGWVRLRPYSDDAGALLHAKTWWIDKPALHDIDVMQVRTQGEDVVAGVRTPQPVLELKGVMPAAYKELEGIRGTLEKHFKDMQDFEFTIQDRQVFMLQTRNGKRTGVAAARIACEMVKEKLIDWETAVMRVPADQGLMLTAITLGGLVLSMVFWAALPVSTPHPHECCKKPEVKAQPPYKPVDAIGKDEKIIVQLAAQVEAIEKQKAEEEAEKEKEKGKAGKNKPAEAKPAAPAPAKP